MKSGNDMNELELREAWFREAKNQTLETLPAFMKAVLEKANDYGTAARAVAACALAAAWAADHKVGLTGFQAGCVMWDFITGWMSWDGKPLRLIDYSELLYPQYESKFEKTIPKKTAEKLVDEADKLLKKSDYPAAPEVVAHWKRIASGKLPFGFRVEDDR